MIEQLDKDLCVSPEREKQIREVCDAYGKLLAESNLVLAAFALAGVAPPTALLAFVGAVR